MVTTTLELVDYYASLLILQYHGSPANAGAIKTIVTPVIMAQTSVQDVLFSLVPTTGTFTLGYNGNFSAAINWNDSAATVQTKLQAVSGLGAVTVSGSIASKTLSVTLAGIVPPAQSLSLGANSLLATATPVEITIEEVDEILPLAVQDGFNLTGANTAVGAQLDILGKYAGVTRTGQGFTSQITLSDSDFLTLIRMAIIKNSAGSSLATIQSFLQQFFPGQILVFDYKLMRMSYFITTGLGSPDLVQLFVSERLLPVPMAVGVSIIYTPVIDQFFQFRTYEAPAILGNPFNDYASYQTTWPWLSYANAVII
jgi:hypothetical protein